MWIGSVQRLWQNAQSRADKTENLLTQILWIHQISLTQFDVFMFRIWQGVDVNSFDLTIGGHMCNKSIDARGYINTALWIVVVDEPCDQQVLMEIMALTGFGSVGVI